MKQPDVTQDRQKVNRPRGRFVTNLQAGFKTGTVVTVHGIVQVYAQWEGAVHTRFHVVLNGYSYSRVISAMYGERYLITLANRFAQDVVCGMCD